MYSFIIEKNTYLKQNIKAFYHIDYVGYQKSGNPDYINILKNTFGTYPDMKLNIAIQQLKNVLFEDLPQILQLLQQNSLTVCVIPRAKAENSYKACQLLLKSTIRNAVNQLDGFYDGTDFLIRHTNTKTTHLRNEIPSYNNDGKTPYSGITSDTCHISDSVKGKDILLIDDIYTKSVNIDEDAIQTLLDKGANSVAFYAIARTASNQNII